MTQTAIQVSETPPLSGLALVQQLNGALLTLGTDFAGPTDPAASSRPYMTWADTNSNTLRRRNAGNTAWISERQILVELKSAAYADILGSVVAGSILQSGNNASGSFLLLADGTQLTWGTVYVNASVAAGEAVFPSVSSPSVFVGAKRSIVEVDFYVGSNGAGDPLYTSKQNYQLRGAFINTGVRIQSAPSFTALGSSAAASYSLSFLEIGRWKA